MLTENKEILLKDFNNKAMDSLINFWNDKVRQKSFLDVQNIYLIVSDIDKMIKVFEAKRLKKKGAKITMKKELYTVFESNNCDNTVRASLPIHYIKKKIYDNITETEETIITITTETYEVSDPKTGLKPLEEGKEEEEYDEDLENNKKDKISNYYSNRLNSSNNLLVYEFQVNDDGDEDSDEKKILRLSKKAVTVGGGLNNLQSNGFEYQEELENINFIIKMKKLTSFINFIDIDLFLQYIALEKNFFENLADDKTLIEGFCLQYQTFIFPRTLISKIISCFEFFFSHSEIIEEKTENEEDEKEHNNANEKREEDEENLVQRRKNTLKIKKISESAVYVDGNVKIPFGLIDLICTFINIHNIYYHNELPNDVISKIYSFLKKLKGINEIKGKYHDKIEMAEDELKDYETALKNGDPININSQLSSSDGGFDSEKEEDKKERKDSNTERAEKKSKVKLPKAGTFSSQSFKLNNLELKNKSEFMNIYSDQKKKEEDKSYEFDLLKYKPEDIAYELTRVNYTLYLRVQIKEFLKGVFNGKDKFKLSPNICHIIKRFNTISAWVVEEILAYDHAEKRSQILLTFIKVCAILEKIGNFDDCLSILTGLTNFNINKLQKTWGHIKSLDLKQFRGLKRLLSFEDNWKILRTEIDKKIEEKKFFIPYLGYYTKRIMYLEEMGPYIKKGTSLMNIEKILEIYKVLQNFYKLREVKNKYHCSNENIRKELYLLQCLDPSNEDFMIQTANLLEPKFILSNKKLNTKRRTKTDTNFWNNINKTDII